MTSYVKRFSVTITVPPAPGNTVIELAASQIAAGNWSANATNLALPNPIGMSIPGRTMESHSKYGGRSPFFALESPDSQSVRNILDWPGRMMHDTQTGLYWFGGGPTDTPGVNVAGMTLVSYNPSTDEFIPYQGHPVWNSNGLWGAQNEAHNFDSYDIDVGRRRIYRIMSQRANGSPPYTNGWTGDARIGVFELDAPADSGNLVMPTGTTYWVYGAMAAFPERGVLLVNRGTANWRVHDITTGALTDTITQPGNANCEGASPVYYNGNLYYTQGPTGTGFYRLGATGNPVQIGNSPVPMSCVSYYSAQGGCVMGMMGSMLYCFHSNGRIYRVSLANGSPYTWQDVAPIPVNVVSHDDNPNAYSAGYTSQVQVGAIGDVFLWLVVKQESSVPGLHTGPKNFLWKPPA